MKRVIAAIIAVCYLCVSTGFTLRAHYCMGQAQGTDVSFFSGAEEHDHTCPRCGMTKGSGGDGCCKDDHKVVKLEQKHVAGGVDTGVPVFAGLVALPLAHHSWEVSRPFIAQAGHCKPACHGPPGLRSSGVSIYLRVRNFRV